MQEQIRHARFQTGETRIKSNHIQFRRARSIQACDSQKPEFNSKLALFNSIKLDSVPIN